MQKIALIAALVAAFAAPPCWAAGKPASHCLPAAAREAEQGLRYLTQLGIAANTCTTIDIYAGFRVRNRDAIVAYQKTMIAHLHGNAAFDHWNTALANQLAQHERDVTPKQFCEQSWPMLKQASTLDLAGYRAYAAAQAATAAQAENCGK